ncbi:MAG: DEAD/DEAH box helicase [Gammaproteobacteria bacterium]
MPTSGSDTGARSQAFERLHPEIQRWIWEQGWKELRKAQERAASPVLTRNGDVVIASPTASGKTEAAFLPILSVLVERKEPSLGVLQVSPLKALINDQHRRLEALCERLAIPVTRWHGDAPASAKKRLLSRPDGGLLITPESLEAIFVVHGHRVPQLVAGLAYVVVDELHAFIGSERGRQLQSLLHRLELAVRRRIPRIGLSATIGGLTLASRFLRPDGALPCTLIDVEGGGQTLKLQIKGYRQRSPQLSEAEIRTQSENGQEVALEETLTGDYLDVAADLYRVLHGTSNLAFVNSKREVEIYADLLRRRSERERVPNEFFPHHANLARELREDLEQRLKDGELPTTPICTSTLELGIDIGSVTSVAQIGAPFSVAGLRQRLGRSGRRAGDPAVLRLYIQEVALAPETPLLDRLRVDLVQAVAVVELLIQRWYEPADLGRLHCSTLIQQLLSLIAQHGGMQAREAWRALCEHGPFPNISQAMFAALVRGLAGHALIAQADDGTLIHGELGERLVNDHRFFAAFTTAEEYRLTCDGRTLGSLPIAYPLYVGAHVIFAGCRWEAVHVDDQEKVVELRPSPGGKPPKFGGSGGSVHERVRQVMRAVYGSHAVPRYLDETAVALLQEGRDEWRRAGLQERPYVTDAGWLWIFPWHSDKVSNALALMFHQYGLQAQRYGPAVVLSKGDPRQLLDAAEELAESPPDPLMLAATAANRAQEKYDRFLPELLSCEEYCTAALDTAGAVAFLKTLVC